MTSSVTGERVFLRDVIGSYMVELGEQDPRVVVVNADLMGTCRNRSFVERFPKRSFNVGIAEQNLVSFAAGLAHEGFIPYVFSMAPFLSMRACEQVRTDVAYSNLNVRLIGMYAGCSGGISGVTYWGMEDCAIIGSMPNMVIREPCDKTQARRMLDDSLVHQGPVYLRCSVEPVRNVYAHDYCFRTGIADVLREGKDGAFLCSGVIVQNALDAAERIYLRTGKSIAVMDIHDYKPLDRDAVKKAAHTGVLVVAQDHNVRGGLGTHIGQILAEEGLSVRYAVRGIPDQFVVMAHAPYLYHKFMLDADGLEETMMQFLPEQTFSTQNGGAILLCDSFEGRQTADITRVSEPLFCCTFVVITIIVQFNYIHRQETGMISDLSLQFTGIMKCRDGLCDCAGFDVENLLEME